MDNLHGALFSAQICYPKLQAFNLLIGSTPDSACVCGLCHFSCVWLFATPWTVARHAPLSMGFPRGRILEWVAIPFSKGSSQPWDWTQVSCIASRFFTFWATREALGVSRLWTVLQVDSPTWVAPGICLLSSSFKDHESWSWASLCSLSALITKSSVSTFCLPLWLPTFAFFFFLVCVILMYFF